MSGENSFFGGETLDLGPCTLYWDTASGGDYLDLGGCDSCTITQEVSKTDLVEAQGGTGPQDKVITAQRVRVKFGLSRATMTRLAAVIDGFELVTNTAGDPVRLQYASKIGQRDSDRVKQLTAIRLVAGVEQDSDPDMIVHFWRAAPSAESVEWAYDAATQRFTGVEFECYMDSTKLSTGGAAMFYATATNAGPTSHS